MSIALRYERDRMLEWNGTRKREERVCRSKMAIVSMRGEKSMMKAP